MVLKCLAKDREDRFPDADAAYATLDRIANPPALWPKLAAAVAILAVLAVYAFAAGIPALWLFRLD